jgi:hypothetical protein
MVYRTGKRTQLTTTCHNMTAREGRGEVCPRTTFIPYRFRHGGQHVLGDVVVAGLQGLERGCGLAPLEVADGTRGGDGGEQCVATIAREAHASKPRPYLAHIGGQYTARDGRQLTRRLFEHGHAATHRQCSEEAAGLNPMPRRDAGPVCRGGGWVSGYE